MLEWRGAVSMQSLESSWTIGRPFRVPDEGIFGVSLNVSLSPNNSPISSNPWSSLGAVFLWDAEAGATVAHVTLQKLLPGATQLHPPQPWWFDNCLQLAPALRLRWTLPGDGHIEIGLERLHLGDSPSWLSFGPAAPGVTNRLMGGADTVIVTLRDGVSSAVATDAFLSSYEECRADDAGEPVGACADATWAGGSGNDNVELLHAEVRDGVQLVRFRRPLVASDAHDHAIVPERPSAYIWAVGTLGAGGGVTPLAQSAAWHYHGAARGTHFSELQGLALGASTYECRAFP